jgi:GTP-binding protein EngB required for normal cell division
MTSLLEGATSQVSRSSDLGARVDGLATAVDAARGRVDDRTVDDAQAMVERVSSRIGLTAEHTVVAIAGATGSGKSSTFNKLAGVELSSVGVRRPTTSWATACVWGKEGAQELLDWLGIAPRHQVMRDSLLDLGEEDRALQGVVLLDLPDHDSTEVSHHLEVDRLIELTDLMIWVLDPQKYADAAVHEGYLAPLATHKDLMLVILNHIDEVPIDRRESMMNDARRLVDADGLVGVPVLATSARTGEGIDALRDEIARRVRAKEATRSRLEADLRGAAERLRQAGGASPTPTLSPERISGLEDAFAEAAGVPTVVDAVEHSTSLRTRRATAWPVTSWMTRMGPDPLKRLQLDLGESGRTYGRRGRPQTPSAAHVARARVDTEVRSMADELSVPLARPWAEAVRRASTSRLSELGERLDDALARTDLSSGRMPFWVRVVWALQWLLLLAAVVGGVWLVVGAIGFDIGGSSTPHLAGVPVPLLLLVGGVVLGVVLALVCRWLISSTARSRARTADQRLRTAIGEVAQELVVDPVTSELSAYDAMRAGLEGALR